MILPWFLLHKDLAVTSLDTYIFSLASTPVCKKTKIFFRDGSLELFNLCFAGMYTDSEFAHCPFMLLFCI